jgi:trehalose 6-phosphate phosphatase
LPRIDDIERCAFFVDLDGTLLEFRDRPDDVRADPLLLQLLRRLSERSGNALAVISGRDIASVDRILVPLSLPTAAVRGLQRRDAKGCVHTSARFDLAPIAFALRATIGNEKGVLIEPKPGAVALHFRMRPDLETRCRQIVEGVVGNRSDLCIFPGKMVMEIACAGTDKGVAIEEFLSEPPFSGRIPVFAGDDPSDEPGFATVNRRHGLSIKVGGEPTIAKFRATDVSEFREWLSELLAEPYGEAAQ